MSAVHGLSRLGALGLLVLGLAACSVKTTVVATSTTAPTVTHLYVTVSALWLNTSATAKPADTTWLTVTLKTPVTVDLSDPTHSVLPALMEAAVVPPGTYRQLRLVLVPNTQALTSSASALSLATNNVVEYGATSLPLEFATQTPSLAIATTLVLKGSTSGTAATDASGSGGASTTPLVTVNLAFDALRHVNYVTQNYGNGTTQTFAIVSAPVTAQDASLAGGLTGTVDVSRLSASSLASSQGLIATAEQLSADGSRHVAVAAAAVQISGTTGTYTLYPLPATASGTTNYDIVIHGPGAQTVLIQAVPVTAGLVSAATSVSADAVALNPAPTYAVYLPPVATNATGVASYANGNATLPLPAGADLAFYQTLPGATSSVPYQIETAALNPLTRQFSATDAVNTIGVTTSTQTNFLLTNADVEVATYNAGGTLTFTTAKPAEGTGSYLVVASAPAHSDGAITASSATPVFRVVPSASAQALYPAPPPSASGTSATLTLALTPSTTSTYNRGTLLISSGGRVVDTVDLTQALLSGGGGRSALALSVQALPAGTAGSAYATAVYDFEVRVWNTGTPAVGPSYSWLTGVDLSQGITTIPAFALP